MRVERVRRHLIAAACAVVLLAACPTERADSNRGDFRVEVRGTGTSCEPWALPSGPVSSRGLPADPTPRVLWIWQASEDPLWRTLGIADQRVGCPSLAPDGSIWVIGPEDRVGRISPDGRLEYLEEGDSGRQILCPLAVAPDGTAYALARSCGSRDAEACASSRERLLVRFGQDGEMDGVLPLDGEAGYLSGLAVGPGGSVYVSIGPRVVATCRGERELWTGTVLGGRRDDAAREVSFVYVDRDGDIWINADAGVASIQATTAGPSPVRVIPDPGRGCTNDFAHAFVGGSLLLPASCGDEVWARVLRLDGTPEWETPRLATSSATFDLAPDGSVWIGVMGAMRRFHAGTQTWSVEQPMVTTRIWGEDGSRIQAFFDRDTRRGGLVRLAAGSGDDVWRIPVTDARGNTIVPVSAINFIHGPDGRVYWGEGDGITNYLVAVQTDVLPPLSGHCVDTACNARHDSWAGIPP